MELRELSKRSIYIGGGIFLFVLSIQLLTTATDTIVPILKNTLSFINSPSQALGFGWLGAYVILSGSPIATIALSFFNAGILSRTATFTMIIGSRLGASFILFVIGFIAYLRGKTELTDAVSIGLLTVLITYTTYFPALLLGLFLLDQNVVFFHGSLNFLTPLTNFYAPIVNVLIRFSSNVPCFLLSIGLVYLSLSVFERGFRKIEMKEVKSSWFNFLMDNPYFSFFFGLLITFAGQSVSLSLGIMIPLYLKGYVQRRNLVPYIMGANIATFVDTISAAFIIQNQVAVNIVFIQSFSILAVSIVCLLFYQRYYTFIEKSMNYLLLRKQTLIGFIILMFVVPFLLLVL